MTAPCELGSRAELREWMDRFYARLLSDERVAHLFAGVDMDRHMPILVDFWAMMLLGEDSYRSNTFLKHTHLPLEGHHFDVWLEHFDRTLDEYATGTRAELARQRAHSIAAIFRSKLLSAKR